MAVDTVNALTTLADAKVWIAIKSANTDHDAILESFIDSVSWQFNAYTNRLLKAREITGYYEGDGSVTFMTPEYPLNSITSLHIDSDREYGDDTLIDSDTYVFYEDGMIKADESLFSKEPKAIKLVHNVGFTTIPADIVVAVKDQVKWLYRRWKNNQEGITSVATINGDTTLTEAGEMLTSSMEIMKRYIKRDHAIGH